MADAPEIREQPASEQLNPVQAAAFENLLRYLRDSRSFDFTGYKRPSLVRRVRLRMSELGIEGFEEYQDVLALQPEEFTALFNTILINVTSFFRDEAAWRHLADEVLPALLAAADSSPVRVWSAGCAAGQEAYSLSMLLHDAMGDDLRSRVKIYATDVDEEALAYARQASYTEREMASVPEEFRRRFFERSHDRFALRPDVRRSVIFGRNDLTRDAPISRIDILACRNTLMYFNAETQSRIANRLSFALRPDGVLFLGKAEMLLNHSSVFEAIDLERRIFRKTGVGDAQTVPALGTWRGPRPVPNATSEDVGPLHDELVMANPVAQIALTASLRLAVVNRRAASFLGLGERDIGSPFQDLEISFRPVELRSHIASALETRLPASIREVEWRRTGADATYVDINIVPLSTASGRAVGVALSFTDVTGFRALRVENDFASRQLETAYEELQSTNEELETTNEELQSTVEELETTNEELQSTNEGLETMNGELQAANDDLQVGNEELQRVGAEIVDLNSFTESVLASLGAAVVVVDRDLVIRAWTPQAEELWGLRATEVVGRSFLELDSGMPVDALAPALRAVFGLDGSGLDGSGLDGSGAVQAAVERFVTVDRRGRPITLRTSVTAMVAAGKPSGALVMMEDVSGDAAASSELDPTSLDRSS
ncbi:MAG: CheR family methyltransferase [Jatrophihabitans sp.]